METRERIWEVVELAAAGDWASKVFDIFIISMILLNIAAVIVGSLEGFSERYSNLLDLFEILSVAIFTAEYLLRVWACTSKPMFSHPIWGRLKFCLTFAAVVDAMAVLPFYLPFILGADFRFLRIMRLFRITRILKLGRYSASLQLIGRVMRNKKEGLMVTITVALILLITVSCLMFYLEHEAQPEAYPSIPAAMWWGVVTLTTVGYGDVYPMTACGKLLAGLAAFLGVGLFALPTAILGMGFLEEIKKKPVLKNCPHCGQEIPP